MFNCKNLFTLVLLSTLFIASCSSDDDATPADTCAAAFVTQTATGDFMGDSFTMVEGTATENFADSTEFRIVLYGEMVSGDACDGFNFDKPDSTIIFSVPKVVGTYDLGLTSGYSVTFNDASVVNEVNADVSICGAVEITAVSATQVTGKIDAEGPDVTSAINGDFTVEICN